VEGDSVARANSIVKLPIRDGQVFLKKIKNVKLETGILTSHSSLAPGIIVTRVTWVVLFSDGEDDVFELEEVERVHGSGREFKQSTLLFNEQSGHSARTGYKAYALSTSDFKFLAKNNLQNYFLCSCEWWDFLGNIL
jgi:hypothetical protein